MHLNFITGRLLPSAPSTNPTEAGIIFGGMLGAGAKKEGGNPPTLFFSPAQPDMLANFPGNFLDVSLNSAPTIAAPSFQRCTSRGA